jgi:hypothetical protein
MGSSPVASQDLATDKVPEDPRTDQSAGAAPVGGIVAL